MTGQDQIEFFEIFPWNKNFETGINAIDEEHKQLVYILNQLAAHLANRSNPIILNKIFDELAAYADYHFKSEEKIWSENFKDDEWFTSHETTHASFIDDVIALKQGHSSKSLDDVVQEIVSFLSKWLAAHILDTDKRMAKAVLAIQSGHSIAQAKVIADEAMSGSMQLLINTVLTMYDNLSIRTLDLMREKALRKQAEKALTQSEERWKFILEGGAEGVWDWNIKEGGVYFSGEDARLPDISSFIAQGSDKTQTIHSQDIRRVEAELDAHMNDETGFFISQYRVSGEGSSWSWVLSRGKVVSRDEHGKALRMVGTHSDITERELATLIYQKTNQGMYVTNSNNEIISVNPAFTQITGYSERDVIGRTPRFFSYGEQDSSFYKNMWAAINSTGHWSGEIWNKRKNGETYPQYLNINTTKGPDGHIDHYFALFSDIIDKKKSEALIIEQAHFDPLTKLPNRILLHEHLDVEIRKSNRTKLPFAVLFIDLDHFKDVNDTLGHDIGDILLVEAALRIVGCVRDSDIVARLGGDEFTVVLPDLVERPVVERVTQKIINSLNKPFSIGDNIAYISASIGITIYPDDSDNVISLLRHADQAMYKAKADGRSCFSYFTKSMQDQALIRKQLIEGLRDAVKLNQLEVYYQPIVDCKTGEIYKAEALLRWHHPILGSVSPAEFIPVAEETGLIIGIGDWVFNTAIQQCKIWAETFNNDIQISINLSPLQFQYKVVAELCIQLLKNLGLSGKNIAVEITENLLIKDDPMVAEQLLKFRDAGIQVSLDDFGTGYSSLSYIKKFHIDYLKIDRSFVQNLTHDSRDMALCDAIIVMSHKLGLKVIAEGVETEQQYQLLKEASCDYIQGYFISKPVPVADFDKLLMGVKK